MLWAIGRTVSDIIVTGFLFGFYSLKEKENSVMIYLTFMLLQTHMLLFFFKSLHAVISHSFQE